MNNQMQRIQVLVDEFDIDVFLNALQQICFCNSADKQGFEDDIYAADYWADIGKKLDLAIKAASA